MLVSRTAVVGMASSLFVAAALAACSSSSSDASSSTGGTGTGGSGAGGATGFGAVGMCYSTKSQCGLPGSHCMSLVDNTSTTKKTLRISQLRVTKPALLASKPIEFSIIGPAVTWADDAACGLSAPGKAGQFNWLLEFDTAAKTLKTGGAKPVDDAHSGYCYVNDSFGGLAVAPIAPTPIDLTDNKDGTFTFGTTQKFDISVPIFLDKTATKAPIVLPLKGGTIKNGTLTEGGNCIGKFKGDTLDPSTSPPCQPQTSDPTKDDAYQYTSGATLEGYITAEDADSVIVVDLGQSLCSLLANTAMDVGGVKHCLRDTGGKLDFSKTTTPPDFSSKGDGNNDAYGLGAEVSAAGVKINDTCN